MYKHIAIEGNIGSGKTTLACLLSDDYSAPCILENFEENPFLAKYYDNFEKYALPVELFFLMTRLKQLKGFFFETDLNSKSFFSDFIFDKTKIFASTHLKEESLELFETIFSELEEKQFLPDLVLYLHRPTNELKRNIAKRGRAMEKEIPANYLQSVENSYRKVFEKENRFPVIWLNCGDSYSSSENEQFKFIKKIISKKWANGFHAITLSLEHS